MEITFTPEELKKHEQAVKEHIGRKFQHFAELVTGSYDPLDSRGSVMRALKLHNQTFEGKYPTISKTLGLD